MKRLIQVAACLAALVLGPFALRSDDNSAPQGSKPQLAQGVSEGAVVKRVAAAANAFLETLDESQRGKVVESAYGHFSATRASPRGDEAGATAGSHGDTFGRSKP